MAYDGKYGRVTTEHGNIPDDEPVIIFRARDMNSVGVLLRYMYLCEKNGSPERHKALVRAAFDRFVAWQEANPDKVRVPDSESSRAWLED